MAVNTYYKDKDIIFSVLILISVECNMLSKVKIQSQKSKELGF